MNACTLPEWMVFLNWLQPLILAVVAAVGAAVLRASVKENTQATVTASAENVASRKVETMKLTGALDDQTTTVLAAPAPKPPAH